MSHKGDQVQGWRTGYELLRERDCATGEESRCPFPKITGSGSYLLVVRPPGTLTNDNSLVASSRAVIRHDRLAHESCLDIDCCQLGGGRALQIRQIRIIGSTYKTGGTCAAAGAVHAWPRSGYGMPPSLGSWNGGYGFVCGSSCQPTSPTGYRFAKSDQVNERRSLLGGL